MKAPMFYRIAAVLLLLFAAGHTSGFPWSDPFDILGSSRTYWDFYVGFGLTVTVLLLLAVILAWQLGGFPAATLALMRGTAWAFALCFAAITVVSCRYLFVIPVVFSIVITLCLTAAAWLSARQVSMPPSR